MMIRNLFKFILAVNTELDQVSLTRQCSLLISGGSCRERKWKDHIYWEWTQNHFLVVSSRIITFRGEFVGAGDCSTMSSQPSSFDWNLIFCIVSILHLFYALICRIHRWQFWDLKVNYLAQGHTTIIISADSIDTYICLLPVVLAHDHHVLLLHEMQ